MSEQNASTDLEEHTLQGVREIGAELGRGSYAAVYAVEYKGLTCAAKVFHNTLEEHPYAIGRFKEECAILSRLRHPNIVQFLGIYHKADSSLPALVLECLPMNLDQCLKKYGVLPDEISYSILRDVALALCHLHQQTPPLVHRDLTATNVLLTTGLTAKVSDLGMAKYLFPSQTQRMTKMPGNAHYMPPEARFENPKYDVKVDAFSYGVLMIHLFTGEWPYISMPFPTSDSPQSEADRRMKYLETIGKNHPLMDLILRCLNNDSTQRPEASEMLTQVSKAEGQLPSSASENKAVLLKKLRDKDTTITQLTAELDSTKQELQKSQEQLKNAELSHSAEVSQINLRFADEKTTLSSKVCETEAELTAAKHQISALSEKESKITELTRHRAELQQEILEKERRLAEKDRRLAEKDRRLVEKLVAKDCDLVAKQQEFSQNLLVKNQLLVEKEQQLERSKEMEVAFDVLLQSRTATLNLKESLIASKDETIRRLNQQLDYLKKSLCTGTVDASEKTTETVSDFLQGFTLKWKECKDQPSGMLNPQAVAIGEVVYVGGGVTLTPNPDDDRYIIYKYNSAGDEWSTLPPVPVRLFGLGELNGKLVIVGGKTKEDEVTGKVHVLIPENKFHSKFLPPMTTARQSPAVFSQPSCLTVVGGNQKCTEVEIFIPQTAQWHTVSPAPSSLSSCMTTTVIHDKFYLSEYESNAIHQLHVSVFETTKGSFQPMTEWKNLPDLPHKTFALGCLNECLLAVGGKDQESTQPIQTVLAHSSNTNTWQSIGQLPEPRCYGTTVVLSAGRLLVIGGAETSELLFSKTKKVYKLFIE